MRLVVIKEVGGWGCVRGLSPRRGEVGLVGEEECEEEEDEGEEEVAGEVWEGCHGLVGGSVYWCLLRDIFPGGSVI